MPTTQFWREKLMQTPSNTLFGVRRAAGHHYESFEFDFDDATRSQVKELTKSAPLLVYTSLVAGMFICLRKYSDGDRLCLLSPTYCAGPRPPTAICLPIIEDILPDLSYRELLTKVRAVLKDAYSQQASFTQAEVQLGETLAERAGSSLGDVAMRLDGLHDVLPERGHLLTIEFDRDIEQLHGRARYNGAVMVEAVARRIVNHFRTTLRAALEQPSERLGSLRTLADTERIRLLTRYSAGVDQAGGSRDVIELIDRCAAEKPEATAIEFGNVHVAYGELVNRSLALAHQLHELGIGPGDNVGLWAERQPGVIVGMLAILRAGGCCMPIDPTHPIERLQLIIEESATRVVVASGSVSIPPTLAKSVRLCDWDGRCDAPVGTIGVGVCDGESAAYLLYTSGSTGKPKGVCMPHRGLRNLIDWQLRASCAVRGTKTLQFASLTFDVAFQEIFSTLCSGGVLVLASEEARLDPALLLELLNHHEVQRLFLPFVALQEMAVAARRVARIPSTLKEVITAGEQLRITPPIVSMFRALPDAQLHNHYGPTETHVVTAFRLTGTPGRWQRLPPIGIPISGVQVYLLDRDGEPAPEDADAELCVSGPCVALGYLGRPEQTAERFVHYDWGHGLVRVYRTGDIVRARSDGNIEFVGRRDEQTKVRGHRFEPGELEATLLASPLISQAAVLVQGEDSSSEAKVLAFVVTNGSEFVEDSLLAFVRERVPAFMVPTRIIQVAQLPKTPSGKIDRRTLLEAAATRARRNVVRPVGTSEESVARIWRDVLNRTDIDRRESFFDLGGNSLLAMQVASRMCEELGVDISIRAILDHPTVEGLARVIESETLP
jgi:amino acid adenylation domain-containing protein